MSLINLSKDCLMSIFSKLDISDLYSIERVCKNFYDITISDLWNQYGYKPFAPFNAECYKNIFNHDVENIKIPDKLYSVMKSLFHFGRAYGIIENPRLILIDPNITMKKIGEFIKTKRLLNDFFYEGYHYIRRDVLEKKIENTSQQKPYWIAMIDGIIPVGPCQVGPNLEITPFKKPTVEEASLCILSELFSKETSKFGFWCSKNRIMTKTVVGGNRLVVGGLSWEGLKQFRGSSTDGLNVNNEFACEQEKGVVPIYKFED